MNELITDIYEITINMHRALNGGNFAEFDQLLINRNSLMMNVDRFRSEYPNYQYTAKDKQLLDEARCLDQRLTFLLRENMAETQNSINQIKQNKQVSQKYRPYLKQTNGVYLDSKK